MNFYILNFNHFFLFKCTLDTQNAPLYLLFDIEIYKNWRNVLIGYLRHFLIDKVILSVCIMFHIYFNVH